VSTSEQNTASGAPGAETRPMDLKLEVAFLPVSDAERAKRFYASLGWREDADFVLSDDLRILQFTPPGSPASIIFGTGVKAGSTGRLMLTVVDVEAARAELIERGVEVSEVFHGQAFTADGQGREPGRDPDHQSYGSFATFSDADGNEWLLQEVTQRLPGRVAEPDIAALAGLLLETALHHGAYEKIAPEHDWWNWYAPYLSARERGGTPEQADAAADSYMKEAHGVAVSR
jgi:catechol 2,3-dioxygenase-like lactoylglutathione lyase family enzyme